MNPKNMTRNIPLLFLASLALILSSISSVAQATEAENCANDGGTWVVDKESGNGFCYVKLEPIEIEMPDPWVVEDGTIDPDLFNSIIYQPETKDVQIPGNYLFAGSIASFYDGFLYDTPGSYTDGGYTFELAADQWAISILFDWSTSQNIHALTILEVLNGGSFIRSIDSDGDGILGQQLNNGPFIGANFYLQAGSISPIPVPAAIWLFISGLLGMSWKRFKGK